jgi:hypothetical protein
MNAELFSQSPLLALPMFALFVFVAVFLAVGLRALLTADAVVAAAAAMPLNDEGGRRHES